MSELFSGRGEKCSGGGKKNLARFAREIIVPILIFLVPKISRPPLTEILYPPLALMPYLTSQVSSPPKL